MHASMHYVNYDKKSRVTWTCIRTNEQRGQLFKDNIALGNGENIRKQER